MQVFDNVNKTVRDDLAVTIEKGSRLSIAACFSIYAYQTLKKQLDDIKELRFISTSPAFVTEKAPKEKREFYIPRLNRERSLYGSEFEVKLRNELSQKAVARECAEWIRRKVRFMSNTTSENMGGFLNVVTPREQITYMPLNGFTTVDIGCERGNNSYNMMTRFEAPSSSEFIRLFDTVWRDEGKLQDVTEQVIDSITAAYNENPADFLYFLRFTISLTSFWRTYYPMKPRALRRAKSGICSIRSKKTPCLPSSANWSSTTAASLRIVLAWVKPFLR
jgi:hypothetical protein